MIIQSSDENIEEGLYEPIDQKKQSTTTDIDDYKETILELHAFYNRQKSKYKWDNLK